MADDDDVPDELWDMLDTLGHSKSSTMTQAPSAAFRQPAAPKAAGTGYQHQPNGFPTWRPQQVQLPLAPPSKPASLAQQLAGNGQFPRAPAIALQQGANDANGLPRYNQQQHQIWQPKQAWGTTQWSANHHAPNSHALAQQPVQQQAPLVSPAALGAAAAGAASSSAAGPFNHVAPAAAAAAAAPADVGTAAVQQAMQATQALTPQQLQQELERLRRDLAAQAGMTTQLRSKLSLAEQEKQQLQQRVQHQQYPTNSITHHKTQELEKQVQSMQTKLMFTEQELSEAKKKATDKESKAADVETRFKQLQDELRRKEEQMLQMEVELEQEKQRVERLAANPAAAAAAAGSGTAGVTYSRQQSGHGGVGLGLGFTTPGSSGGRKRRLNAANPAAGAGATQSPYVAAADGRHSAPAASGQQQQMTPLQQHKMQMQQLLQGQQGASKLPQQQQQQEMPVVNHAADSNADVQQQMMQVDQAMPLQQQDILNTSGQQQQQQAEQQQQQQPAQGQPTGLIMLLDELHAVQVTELPLFSRLWCTCKPALQQLLQPLSAQLPNFSSSFNCSVGETAQKAAQSQLLPLLASAQQQLQAAASSPTSGNATGLLLLLLQLVTVLCPPGGLGLGSGDSGTSGAVETAAPAVASAAAADASHNSSSSSKWVLQQPDSPMGSRRSADQTQQQQYLVFRGADNTQAVHVLPLQLAVAVLQLLQGLVLLDDSCLITMAAAAGASHISGSHLFFDSRATHWCSSTSRYADVSRSSRPAAAAATFGCQGAGFGRPATVYPASSGCISSSQELSFLEAGGSYSKRSGSSSSSSSSGQGSSSAAAAAVSYWASAEAAAGSVLRLQHSSSSSSSSSMGVQAGAPAASKKKGQDSHDAAATERKRTLFGLLGDACRSHLSLQLPVGSVLAVLAGRLPAALQLLLLPAVADSSLVVQLLHSEGYQQRCEGAAVLQQMLMGHGVAAAFAAAIGSTAADSAAAADGSSKVQGQDRDSLSGNLPAPLQPSNRNVSFTQHTNRAAAKAAVAAAFQEKPQQQQQQQTGLGSAAGVSGGFRPCSVPSQAVYDLLFGLLECISCGIGDLPRQASTSSDNNSRLGGVNDCNGSSSSKGWGVFELQRRACATVAEMLQTRQAALLQVMLDSYFTSGFGLSQRLLALVDAACSAEAGDPFCTATPLPPNHAAAAAGRASGVMSAAAANLDDRRRAVTHTFESVSDITGKKCEWWECLERLRLSHEALLLLRALMATGGPVGLAATADICSNMTSIRMVQTTRAKLSEWSDALLATAAAGTAQGADMPTSHHTTAAAAATAADPTAAAGLPLASWAWAYSSSCGCRDKHSSYSSVRVGRSGGPSLLNVPGQLLRSQRPLLQDCLQEISSAAASVHRRAIQYLT